jgi:Protein of unknown function (DUF2934)
VSIEEHSPDIAERAYFIWEQAGRLDGRALEHWLQAEAELAKRKAQVPTGNEARPAGKLKRSRAKKI